MSGKQHKPADQEHGGPQNDLYVAPIQAIYARGRNNDRGHWSMEATYSTLSDEKAYFPILLEGRYTKRDRLDDVGANTIEEHGF